MAIFAIDFDGTIVEHKYPAIGKPKQCTVDFIKDLKIAGHTWTLLTMREGKYLEEALSFLSELGIKPDYVNDNPPELIEEFKCNPRKVYANYYLDDRNAFTVDLQILYFRHIVKDLERN